MLVDPYFSDDLFEWLYSSTSLSRVLLCRRPENLTVLSLFLGGVERAGARALEVRYLEPRELHDRYLVGRDGAVSMIGASLNGLHRNFTAIVRLPDPAGEAIRARVEEDWSRAARVEPQAIRAELSVPEADHEMDVKAESGD